MYGLLFENLSEYVKAAYGDEKWEEIRRLAMVDIPSFSTHQVYPENLLSKLSKKAIQVLGVTEQAFMDEMGVFFVRFVGQYGYDRVLSVLGRHMRDFLNGLDNLHEYLKFSYPRMKAPSFFCENETNDGLTLHYRSKRRGFVYYTMGQITEVSRHFYKKEMRMDIVREEMVMDTVHVTFQCTFDNSAYTKSFVSMTRDEKLLPISASMVFELFPFCIVFGNDMVVRSIGNSLQVILPELVERKITESFDLVRPLINFNFATIMTRSNNIFEIMTVEPVASNKAIKSESQNDDDVEEDPKLKLKGQMIYMDSWRMMMYLGTPMMPDLNALVTTGLYINDLSMHDFSRDLMLAGTQQSVELKLALDQEQQKSKKLEDSMKMLDDEMKRTDELLYQMIPKQVAVRLRNGENPIDTCEIFESVTVLFSDVVTFTQICSRITPMEVVSMLNSMYSIFDNLTEINEVYKVETIGDAYMAVGGAPNRDASHAEKICNMALDMIEAITDLKDPSTGDYIRIRVGVHSGNVVAGIVGMKMPRYCLFGDAVNTASRMESTSEAMKIHISASTRELLPGLYAVQERGVTTVKGKGEMKTFWLTKKEGRIPLKTGGPQPSGGGKAPAGGIQDAGRGYAPVTHQEVAKRSTHNTPVQTPLKAARSNSIAKGTAYLNSPAENKITLPAPAAAAAPQPAAPQTTPTIKVEQPQSNHTAAAPSVEEWPPPSKPVEAWASPQKPKQHVTIVDTDQDNIDSGGASHQRRHPCGSQSDGNLYTRAKRMIFNNVEGTPQCTCVGVTMKIEDSPQTCCAGMRGGDQSKHRNSVACVLV